MNNFLIDRTRKNMYGVSDYPTEQLYTIIERMDIECNYGLELVQLHMGLIYYLNTGFFMGMSIVEPLRKSEHPTVKFVANNIYKNMQGMYNILLDKENTQKNEEHNEFINLINYELTIAAYRWEDTKVVYSIDNDFARYFGDSDSLKVYVADLYHLPCNTMYIDFKKIERFQEDGRITGNTMEGMTVNISKANINGNTMLLVMFTPFYDNGVSTPQYVEISLDICKNDNGNYYLDYEKMYQPHNSHSILDEQEEDDDKQKEFRQKGRDSIDYAIMLAWNFLAYISSKKPDIKESKISVKAKNRAERMKKPYEGETVYEVGYRYGKAISLYNERVKREYSEHHTLYDERKPARPHFVKAHWQGYWCGEERSEFWYIWKAPYYTGFGEIDCIIHDCIEVDKPNRSQGENTLYFLLNMKGIKFEEQYYIPENGKYFDFCLMINDKQVFLEYDGAQHFRPVKNWDYEATVESDTIKNNYCAEHNIPLIRIRYDQNMVIDDILEAIKNNPEQFTTKMNPFMSDEEYYSIRRAVD